MDFRRTAVCLNLKKSLLEKFKQSLGYLLWIMNVCMYSGIHWYTRYNTSFLKKAILAYAV